MYNLNRLGTGVAIVVAVAEEEIAGLFAVLDELRFSSS